MRDQIATKIAEAKREIERKKGNYADDNWLNFGYGKFDNAFETLSQTSYANIEQVINAIKSDPLSIDLSAEPLIPIQGVNCSYNDMKKLRDEVIPSLHKTVHLSTPYITQVVQHWYRNQYFTMEGNEFEKAKEIAISFFENLKLRLEARSENGEEVNVSGYTDAIENIEPNDLSEELSIDGAQYLIREDVKAVTEILKSGGNELINRFTDETVKENMRKYLNTKIESIGKSYGTTYKKVPVADKWTGLEGFEGSNERISAVISNSFWRITSTDDIIQLHNPVFEDNSQFIRGWLKEKYVIYDGISTPEEERILEGKSYIQGKTALENVVEMLDKATTSDKYLKYMKRDVIEFMQDYGFDLDQIQDTVAEKNLENIMPDYVPYTPWPSAYEKADSIWTKMIYKTEDETDLKAPADCVITTKGEIKEIGILDETGLICEYVYLCSDEDSKGNKITNINVADGKYKKGAKIGTASPSDDSEIKMISIKLQMLTNTKQRIDITTRMNVRNKEVSEITELEKVNIYHIMSAAQVYENEKYGVNFQPDKELYGQECLALLNVALNRIASPYCNEKDLEDINWEKMGIKILIMKQKNKKDGWVFKEKPPSNPERDLETDIDTLISLALRGSDRTKEGTILGATAYAKVWQHKRIKLNQEDVATIYSVIPEHSLKMAIGGGGFYLPNEEYQQYQTYYVNDKVRSVFIQLNEQKDELNKEKGYSAGYGKYQISRTEEAGEELQKYLTYVEDTIYGIAENTCVRSVIITEINEEIKEDEEKQFVDTFRIRVNSNVAVDVTIKYNCTEEGKILYDTMEYSTEEVERL